MVLWSNMAISARELIFFSTNRLIKLAVAVFIFDLVSGQQNSASFPNRNVDQADENSVKPTIEELDAQMIDGEEGNQLSLSCTATAIQLPTIQWLKTDGKDLEGLGIMITSFNISEHTLRSLLQISALNLTHQGWYDCIAENGQNNIARIRYSVTISHSRRKSQGAGHGATVGVVFTVVIVTLLGVGVWAELIRRKNRLGLSKRDVELFLKGNPQAATKQGFAHENAMLIPYDNSYELDEDKLKIDKEDILGAGNYGMVLRAKYDGKLVAVKTVKPGADKSYLKALLTELKIMIHIGRHPSIVDLLGACSKDLRRGIAYVVVALYPLGNVENYLRMRRYIFVNEFDESGVFKNLTMKEEQSEEEGLATRDLLLWAYQIADGMHYLGDRNIIHGDLAARNILLDENRNAKITDFGLARKMYDYANYVKKHQEPLPWRWMAIESLRELSFSPKSDIWSYGVLLWELFTCGDVPYPGFSWTTDFVDKLENGLRLSRPKYASREIYRGIMENCWHFNPQDRISFSIIRMYFKDLLETIKKQPVIK